MVSLRRRLLVTNDEVEKTSLRRELLNRLSEGRRLLGYDMILRSPRSGLKQNHLNTPPIALYLMHKELSAKDRQNSGREVVSECQPQKTDEGGLKQIVLEFQTVISKIGDAIEVSFALYDTSTKEIVTEEYYVKCSTSGMPEDESLIGNAKTIFKDVTMEERATLCLLVKVVRIGKLVSESSKKSSKSDNAGFCLRRPIGIGLLQVSTLKTGQRMKEQRIPIWTSSSDQLFSSAAEHILQKSLKDFVESSDFAVIVKMAMFSQAGEVADMTLKGIRITNRIAMTPVPQSRRNDLYVTLVDGDFSKEKSGSFEISVSARRKDGTSVLECASIGPGCTPQTTHKSLVLYHQNTPRWNERVRFSLAPQDFSRIHLYFEVYQWSAKEKSNQKPPIAFGFFVPSKPNGTVIDDGKHEIGLFKAKNANADPEDYLEKDLGEQGTKLRLTIETTLSSNRLTQKDGIFYLMNWKENPDKISEALAALPNADPNDVVKFLSPILGSLFCMLEDQQKLAMFIFNNVMHVILLILEDKTGRYSPFKTELERFIEEEFTSSEVHEHLLRSFLYYLEKMESKNHQRYIMMGLKALYYLFRLVRTSHRNKIMQIESKEAQEQEASALEAEISKVFDSFSELLTSADKAYLPLQTVVLKSFPRTFALLNDVFPPKDLLSLFTRFYTSIPDKNALAGPKLTILKSLIEQDFYLKDVGLVKQILVMTVQTANQHLPRSKSEEAQCLSVLLSMCNQVHQCLVDNPKVSCILCPLIPTLCDVARNPKGSRSIRLDAFTLVLHLFHILSTDALNDFISSHDGTSRKKLLMEIVQALLQLMRKGYDRSWFAMWMFAYVTGSKLIHVLARHLRERLSEFDKDLKLWGGFFDACLAFVSAPHLQVEESTRKPKMVTDIYAKDIRVEICTIFVEMWEEVGLKQNKLVSSMIGPSIDLMLLPSIHLKKMGLQLYASLLRRVVNDTMSVEQVYLPTVDALIKLSKEHNDSLSDFQTFLLTRLDELFSGSTPEMERAVSGMLKDLRHLLSLLKEFDTIPEGIEWDDERTLATLRLMEFFKKSNRLTPYITYVHELASGHESANRMTEAGLAVLLHANLIDWSSNVLKPILSFPKETNFERKQKLYHMAIKYFDNGKNWERSIALRDELIEQERKAHRYTVVAQILREQADSFQLISEADRYSAEYFRVAFYGKKFPPTLRGKEFVYRGFECERITAFIARMQSIYPNAEVIKKSNAEVSPEIVEGDGQWFVIATVTPSSMWEMKGEPMPMELQSLPSNVLQFRRTSDINVFTYMRPFRKKAEKSANEFEDLWTAHHFLVTAETFPGVLSRSEVVERHVVERSPIVNAIQSISAKNKDIVNLCKRCGEDSGSSQVSSLTMALNGVIDAEVNGGVKMYSQAFFVDEYLRENPDDAGNVARLKEVLRDSVDVLEMALRVHRTVCPANLQALQQKMEVFFEKMKTEIRQTCL
eukprot:TRINITY_DN4306_c0_g2_i1.p1 TRINITY_DN4306_c0_g2~~TRINITY_DN4306_c0_g2_i1.p1  ORF type:complete len:1653 (+),score=406.29 TRINITY_DN4306_c0_g2_i1:578-4960(+)